MKAIENVLYSTEHYVSGKLIKDDGSITKEEVDLLVLTESQAKEIVDILENNIPNYAHRCASVYRDALVVDNVVYNICLSCGDFYKGSEHFYLSHEGIDKIKALKENFQF